MLERATFQYPGSGPPTVRNKPLIAVPLAS